MNAITLTGNVVSVNELVDNGGKTLVEFRMANNERVGQENVLNGYFDVVVFGPQAVRVAEILHKGERVVVTGRINHRTYKVEDAQTGESRTGSRTNIVAMAVALSLEFDAAVRHATETTN